VLEQVREDNRLRGRELLEPEGGERNGSLGITAAVDRISRPTSGPVNAVRSDVRIRREELPNCIALVLRYDSFQGLAPAAAAIGLSPGDTLGDWESGEVWSQPRRRLRAARLPRGR